MVNVKVTKIVNEELEDKEVTKIIFNGSINEIKYNLTLAGEKENIKVLRQGLKVDFGSTIELQLKPIQTTLIDFKEEPKQLEEKQNGNYSTETE